MPIAKSVKRQVRSTESSHIVNTTIRLSHKAVERAECYPYAGFFLYRVQKTYFESSIFVFSGCTHLFTMKGHKVLTFIPIYSSEVCNDREELHCTQIY
jgi:hypothetical protein